MKKSVSTKEVVYDVDYYINKFERIPAWRWTTHLYTSTLLPFRHCALGHLGVGVSTVGMTPEVHGICRILPLVMSINDNRCERYMQRTPKARVLAALYDVKAAQEKRKMEDKKRWEITNPPVTAEQLVASLEQKVHERV
jgi:hypothetical protein